MNALRGIATLIVIAVLFVAYGGSIYFSPKPTDANGFISFLVLGLLALAGIIQLGTMITKKIWQTDLDKEVQK